MTAYRRFCFLNLNFVTNWTSEDGMPNGISGWLCWSVYLGADVSDQKVKVDIATHGHSQLHRRPRALPASRLGIGYLMEGKWAIKGGVG
ncbi:hypothetical protein EVAR_96771_1 [Eumeta japonica]|uniref:Uncharacterized protein n=1 Tax=Eumeta variegata TaxID=151549 RepID=A0A4C1WUZ1_EUMVA|nr:hypothetical protein EVAR_96771_1 [Eumeta japonica]